MGIPWIPLFTFDAVTTWLASVQFSTYVARLLYCNCSPPVANKLHSNISWRLLAYMVGGWVVSGEFIRRNDEHVNDSISFSSTISHQHQDQEKEIQSRRENEDKACQGTKSETLQSPSQTQPKPPGFGTRQGSLGRSSLVKTLPITKKNKHTVVTEAPKKVHVLLSR